MADYWNEGDQRKIRLVTCVAKNLMPDLPYHNFCEHVVKIDQACARLAYEMDLPYSDRFLLATASRVHDIILVPGANDNEEKSAQFAKEFLPQVGYGNAETQRVEGLILATKLPQNPRDYLEEIICDADLYNFGDESFFDCAECVRQELGIPNDEKWMENIYNLLTNHEYHTEVARALRNAGKKKNIRKLEKMIATDRHL